MSEWFSGIKAKFILDFIADQRWKYITDGLKVTLEVTFLALILGLVLGAVIAVIRTTHDQLKEDQSKGFGSVISMPSKIICPDVGRSKRFMQRRKVDLPEPDGPMITIFSPGAI